MQTIAINSNNDIFVDNSGNLAIAKDLEAMGNIFINKSQTNKDELLYSDKGIDFFNTIFSSPVYPDLFQNELINQLVDTESTKDVDNFQANIENGIFKYSVDIQTEYGRIALNG